MSNPNRKRNHAVLRERQVPIAFPSQKTRLDVDERSQVLALLSRLLLQVAAAARDSEVGNDAT